MRYCLWRLHIPKRNGLFSASAIGRLSIPLMLGHPHCDNARSNGIGTNAMRCKLTGKAPHHGFQRGFGRSIRRDFRPRHILHPGCRENEMTPYILLQPPLGRRLRYKK